MPVPPLRRRLAIAWLLAAGCSRGDDPAWALQHASVRVEDGDLAGYQVWEFYKPAWEKKRDEKHHVCALVQAIAGTPADALAGCAAGDSDGQSGGQTVNLGGDTADPTATGECVATFAVTASVVESDCDPEIAENPDFSAMTHYAIGGIASDLASDDPFPGQSLGWYVSWDGLSLQAQGFAWNELVEGGAAVSPTWESGVQYTLWPAYAWEL